MGLPATNCVYFFLFSTISAGLLDLAGKLIRDDIQEFVMFEVLKVFFFFLTQTNIRTSIVLDGQALKR